MRTSTALKEGCRGSEDIRAAVQYWKQNTKEAPLLVPNDWGAYIGWLYAPQAATTSGQLEVAGYVSLAIPPPTRTDPSQFGP